MGHNARIRPEGGWLLDSTVDPSEFEAFDAAQYSAINGDDGGTWAPTSRIILGGEGLEMRALLAIGNGGGSDGTIEVRDGSGTSWLSGSALLQYAGSEWVMSGTTAFGGAGLDADGGAGHHVVSGGKLYVDDGATVKVRVGGTIEVAGHIVASSGSEVRLYGETRQYLGEFILSDGVPMTLHGDVTLKSDGSFATEIGSNVTFGGATTIGNTGTLVTDGSGSITVTTGGALVVNSGATATVNGTLAGSITRTAAVTRSGSTANEYLRVTTGSDATSTYSPTFDLLWYVITDDRTYKITDGTTGQMIRIACRGVASKILTIVNSSDVVVATLDPAVCAPAAFRGLFVDLIWWGGTWQITAAHGASSA